jgi:hypothetical protein
MPSIPIKKTCFFSNKLGNNKNLYSKSVIIQKHNHKKVISFETFSWSNQIFNNEDVENSSDYSEWCEIEIPSLLWQWQWERGRGRWRGRMIETEHICTQTWEIAESEKGRLKVITAAMLSLRRVHHVLPGMLQSYFHSMAMKQRGWHAD